MRATRLVLATVVLGTVVASGAGAAVHAAPAAPCRSQITKIDQRWQGIKPDFPAGQPSTITQYVNTAYDPDLMYVTNGQSVMVSQDAGCTWIGVVIPPATGLLSGLPAPVGSLPGPKVTTTVTAIAAPSSGNISNYAYVGVQDSSVLGNAIRIGHYDGNWSWSSTGLPATGKVVDIAASPSLPMFAYALVAKTSVLDRNPGLYVTQDGGKTWSLQDAGADPSTLQQIVVDPNVPQLVYAMGSGGILASRDGGRSFQAVPGAGGGISSYDVALAGSGLRFAVGHADMSTFGFSNDAGTTWQTFPSPVRSKQVALQPILGQVAVSDGHQLWRFDTDKLEAMTSRPLHCKTKKMSAGHTHATCRLGVGVNVATNITPAGNVAVTGLQFTAPSTTYSLSGYDGDQILRAVFKLDGSAIPPGLKPLTLLPGSMHQFPSTLFPGKSRIALPPGGHRDVSYKLLLPRTPSPVDVMFLIDTTSSTEHTSAGLRKDLAGIVNDLGKAGLNAEFGVGDFKDYPPKQWEPGDGDTGDYPYRLDARIGPVSPMLRTALSKLRASGGGDPAEADLTALYQSTTGAGQRLGRHVIIKPGLQAGYRPDALKLAVLATDEVFHQARDYLTPSWDKTVAALRAYDVHPIGLAIQYTDENSNVGGFRSLRTEQNLGRDTGSLAPRGGVDCNGDLKVDVQAGQPFVCKVPVVQTTSIKVGTQPFQHNIQPVKLTSAITTAAELFADYRAVGLAVGGHPGIARVITPHVMPTVNLKVDNLLHFTVRYTCPRAHKPQLYPMQLNAGAAGRVLASSAADVACGAVPLPKKHPILPPPVAAAVIAAPAAPAAPGTPGNPPPNTNPNPNPALNGNVGFASQEEEQRQLAYADADAGVAEDTSTELAMSRLEIGAAVLLAGAFGFAARHRFARRESTALAWHRRR